MKKKLVCVFGAVCLLLTGCGQALPDGMESDETVAAGEEVAELIGTGESDAVYDLFREDVAESLSREDVAAMVPKSAGAWEGISASEAMGRTDDASGEEYALVMVMCDFEQGQVTISVALDQDLKLIGLQIGT